MSETATATAAAEPAHHIILPVSAYLKVFGALVFLTALTILVSYAGLGPLSLPIALIIAVTKAGFVVGYFMHLKYDGRFMSIVFFSALLFLGVFFVLTIADVRSRGMLIADEGNRVLEQDRAALHEQQNPPAAAHH
jgi:cytochrome c oxidase subunit 4